MLPGIFFRAITGIFKVTRVSLASAKTKILCNSPNFCFINRNWYM